MLVLSSVDVVDPALLIPLLEILFTDEALEALRVLEASEGLFESNRPRSAAAVERTVPPRIFSRATDVEAEALFGVLGHWPYQLLALRTCESDINK